MYTRYIYIYIYIFFFKSMNTNEHRERILPGGAGPLTGWLIVKVFCITVRNRDVTVATCALPSMSLATCPMNEDTMPCGAP